MKKKIFLLTVLTAVFALLLCFGAGASSGVTLYGLWVDGIQVTSANADDVLGNADEGATVKYDAATNTLTLDGAMLTTAHTGSTNHAGVIYAEYLDALTINVVGDSSIVTSGNGDISGIYLGPVSENTDTRESSVILTGDAALDITVNQKGTAVRARTDISVQQLTLNLNITSTSGGSAIDATDSVTIKDNANVTIDSKAEAAAIYSKYENIEIRDAVVNITALSEWANSIYTSFGNVIITGNANVTANSYNGISAGDYMYDASINESVPCGEDIIISGNAMVNSNSTDGNAFWTLVGKIIITDNVQVTASGYLGIYATGNVEITGGTVKAQGETNYAIYSWADTIIKNSIVEAISDPEYYSIGAYNTVEIESSWVSSNNGTYGAIITNSVEVTDGRGQAYGDAVLPGDVTVPEGYALVLREGDYLTIPEGVTLTNYGTVQVLGGCLTNNGIYMDYGETLGEIQGSGDFPNNWFVTVSYGNGAADTVYRIVKGEDFILPDAPSKPGYIFLGWRCGQDTFGAGDMVDIISNAAFQAVWANMPDISPSEPDEPVEFPFTDVSEADWYYDAVYYVWANGVMEGVEADEFAPNSSLTRAMVWAMLARLDGVEVSGDGWVAAAQEWAVESGVSDGTDPTGYITREQLVTMLWRCKGSPAVEFELTAPDAGEISDWALEAMRWAAATGLIEGDEFGNLTPTATSTRAQAATFMLRFGK